MREPLEIWQIQEGGFIKVNSLVGIPSVGYFERNLCATNQLNKEELLFE